MYKKKNNARNLFTAIFINPFKMWYRIFSKNAPYLTDTGVKNFKERVLFWIITVSLPFIILIAIAYSVEGIRELWKSIIR